MRVDRGFAHSVEDAQLLADGAERVGDEVVGAREAAVAQEQVAHRLSEIGIVDASVVVGLPQRDQRADRLGGFLMEWDGAFLEGLACREPQPRGAVRVGVEAVEVELADLGAAGAAPPGDQQRAPLQRAAQLPDVVHDGPELVFGDEPGDALDDAGHVGVRDQGRAGTSSHSATAA